MYYSPVEAQTKNVTNISVLPGMEKGKEKIKKKKRNKNACIIFQIQKYPFSFGCVSFSCA